MIKGPHTTIPPELRVLHAEMGTLAAATGDARWDEKDAKAIGRAQWVEALAIAEILRRSVVGIPKPDPGADPLGFIWLTYSARLRVFALEISSSLLPPRYRWTVTRDGTRAAHHADHLRDVVESLRATFGHTEEARILVVHA